MKICCGHFLKTKQCTLQTKIVCPGVAHEHGLRISGHRNALCTIHSRRRSPWLSGTMPLFAFVFRSNTHTCPNFRVPLTEKTHDCPKNCLSIAGSIRRLQRVAQKAAKQMVGYFCGYISKRQPIGRYELKLSSQNLALMQSKLQEAMPSQQLAMITNRMFCDLEAKGVLRSALEDFNLAAHADDKDEFHVEFIRTFRSVNFYGVEFVKRYNYVLNREDLIKKRRFYLERVRSSTNVMQQESSW